MKFTFVIPDMSWLLDYKAQFSLGILYIASMLKKKDIQVYIFDTNVHSIDYIEQADIYGFSSVFNTYNHCIELAKSIKNKYPNSKLIIGGPHPSCTYLNVDKIFDSIFIGEAEQTIIEFINDFPSIKKVYKQDSMIDISDLYPDRSILSDSYIRTKSIFSHGTTYDNNGSTAIMFSRGCPYNCSFCASPKIYNRKLRLRPVESIIKEIKDIKQIYGIKQFRIQDDTFTINIEYLRYLCSELEKENIFYRCSTRVNHISDEVLELLHKSGCREIGIGIECADDNVLKKLNKNITVKQAEKAIKLIQKFLFDFRCFFIVGLPFDSKETLQKNINFIESNNIKNVTIVNFIPFPGTDMFINKNDYNIKEVKDNICMNINRKVKLVPNIIRTDISEKEHLKILEPFYEWMIQKKFV